MLEAHVACLVMTIHSSQEWSHIDVLEYLMNDGGPYQYCLVHGEIMSGMQEEHTDAMRNDA